MPRLMVANPKGQGVTGQGGRADWAYKWMEEMKQDKDGEPAVRNPTRQRSSNQTLVHQLQQTCWSHTLRTLRQDWYKFASVGVVWSVCQVEAPLRPSLLVVDVCWRLLLVCLLWMLLGGCVHALHCCLRPGQNQGEPPPRIQQEVVTEHRNNHHLWAVLPRRPSHNLPLALALADSLLLCVLQEPLPDPNVPHIKALLSRLGSVCHTLEKADIRSEATLEEVERDSTLIDKVKLICSYLHQRMSSLHRLVQVQGDFEARVKDMLEGLEGLWAQLEEVHTGVTLTKKGSRGHGDLVSAQTDTETLFAFLNHYKNRLHFCQDHLTDSTQLLQELAWSHTHISNSVRSCSESVWPELLLQSNIEQFDKVQESFASLEQQMSTFQAHLEGLGKEDQERHAEPLTQTDRAHSRSVSPQTSLHLDNGRKNNVWHRDSISTTSSVSSMEADTELDSPVSLRERSILQFTSTIGRLRKSGRRK